MNNEEKLKFYNISITRPMQNQIENQHNIQQIKKTDVDSLKFVK
jgi:hypothetical protein